MLENIIFIPCLREISTGRSIIYVPDGQHDIVSYAVYCLRDVLISPAIAIAFMQSSNLIDIYFCCLSELDHHSFKSFIALHRPPDLQERAHPQQVISSLSPLDQTTLGGLLHYESVIFSLSLSLQFFWCLREHSPDQWPCPNRSVWFNRTTPKIQNTIENKSGTIEGQEWYLKSWNS